MSLITVDYGQVTGGGNYTDLTQVLTYQAQGTNTSSDSYTPTKDELAVITAFLTGNSTYTSYVYLTENDTNVVTFTKNADISPATGLQILSGYSAVSALYKLQAGKTYKIKVQGGYSTYVNGASILVLE